MSTNVVSFIELADRVRRAAAGRPRALVGMDGLGAAGKSTLARQLVVAMGDAALVHVDDFYLPSARRRERPGEVVPSFDLPRLTQQVTMPASAGAAFRYQRYDWGTDTLAEWIDVPVARRLSLKVYFISRRSCATHTP